MNKLKPNFTQTPNIFFDEIMPTLGHAETKCLLYIFRRTYGFQKDSDKISLTQFESGMKNREGEQLDSGTGLKRKSIYQALESLAQKGIVIVDRSENINRYSLYLDYKVGTQSTQTRCVKKPEVGTQGNIQKKEKESIQKKDTKEALVEKKLTPIQLFINELEPLNPVGYTKWFSNTTQRKNVELLMKKFTIPKIRNIVTFISLNRDKNFFPSISTPMQLVDKLPQVETFYKSNGHQKQPTANTGRGTVM